MKKLLRLTLLIVLAATMPLRADIYHVVICWLKEPQSQEAKAQLIETTKALKKIEGIESIVVGDMIPSPRKIVDSSYDVGIIFHFKTKEDMQRYLSHPAHKKALQEVLVRLTSKVVVYDFEGVAF
ncbi:MAG: Dabb family protein [Campylobacterales bacterium]|nr:Dabb family protein [Campylobacterales bacterium]